MAWEVFAQSLHVVLHVHLVLASINEAEARIDLGHPKPINHS